MTSINTNVDQQDTNTALAALAATGNTFALAQLWEINKGLLRSMFWKWYPSHKSLADEHGMTADDFEQEGYFAVQYAAQTYDPSESSFTGWLWQAMQRQIWRALTNGHRRTVVGTDGKRHNISADPLNHCESLDIPLDEEDEGAASLGDLQPDPAASEAFQDVEERIYQEELHIALEEALLKLSEREQRVMRGLYFAGHTLKQEAAEDGTTYQMIYQLRQNALRKLRRNPTLQRWHDEVIQTHAWQGTGFGAWSYGGSVEERAVEFLERYETDYSGTVRDEQITPR